MINQLKLPFFNSLLHEKGSGFCLAIILEEEELFPGTGFVAEIRQICEMYQLEDATKVYLDKNKIREKVWRVGREEVWKETLFNRRIPFNYTHMRRPKTYMRLPRYDARLFFAFKVGELQFKDYRRGEFKAKFGNTLCFGCQEEPDTLEHVMRCKFYENRFYKTDFEYDPETQLEFIEYLKKLDRERNKRFKLPILYRKSNV